MTDADKERLDNFEPSERQREILQRLYNNEEVLINVDDPEIRELIDLGLIEEYEPFPPIWINLN